MADLAITPDELRERIGTALAPIIVDVRRRAAFDADPTTLPAARWRPHDEVPAWAGALPPGLPVVCVCAHGHHVSQQAAAELRLRGRSARYLAGGIEAWRTQRHPVIRKAAIPGRDESRPSRWVTRVRPKIDRIACPWLIARFVDRDAEFLFVEPDQVEAVAREAGAIPYDVEGVTLTHRDGGCTFDALLEDLGLEDPALADLALIVRGADTGRPDLAPQAAGLLAISLGISVLSGGDDHAALASGFPVYDALYAWRRQAVAETHGWPPRAR